MNNPITPEQELVNIANAQRSFTILEKKRAITEAKKDKTKSAIISGAFFLATALGLALNPTPISQIINDEIAAVYSWESLVQYFVDLGPVPTLALTGGVVSAFRSLDSKNKAKDLERELDDLEKCYTGIGHAK